MTSGVEKEGSCKAHIGILGLGQLNTTAEGSHLEVPAPQGTLGNVCDIRDHQDKGGTSPSSPMVKNPPCNEGTGSTLVRELSSTCHRATKPMHHNQSPCSEMQDPMSLN